MRRAMFLLPLLLGGCLCQPDSARAPSAAQAGPTHAAGAPDATAAPARTQKADVPVLAGAVAATAPDESTVVRNYLYALLGSDRATSDAYWRGGRTGSRPDDHVLRVLPQLQSLRVDAEQPVARDTARPSRLREVPVKVRAVTAEGTLYYDGWYRLEPRADGSTWEITGAALQPTLR